MKLKEEDWIKVWEDKSWKDLTDWDYNWIEDEGYKEYQTSGTTRLRKGIDERGEFLKFYVDISRGRDFNFKCISIWRKNDR